MKKHLDFVHTCGYVTFLKTGVNDIGCEEEVVDVKLQRPQRKKSSLKGGGAAALKTSLTLDDIPQAAAARTTTARNSVVGELLSPGDDIDISMFKTKKKSLSPNEDHFAVTPQNASPANEYRSADCNELLKTELDTLNERGLVSQASIEIPIEEEHLLEEEEFVYTGEEWTILEVQFGVPLFDFDCNTKICQSLAKMLRSDER